MEENNSETEECRAAGSGENTGTPFSLGEDNDPDNCKQECATSEQPQDGKGTEMESLLEPPENAEATLITEGNVSVFQAPRAGTDDDTSGNGSATDIADKEPTKFEAPSEMDSKGEIKEEGTDGEKKPNVEEKEDNKENVSESTNDRGQEPTTDEKDKMEEEMKEEEARTRDFGTDTNSDTDWKPATRTLGILCKRKVTDFETQTEKIKPPTILPFGCPNYMPMPMKLNAGHYPIPIPVPLPVTIPVFVKTKRNSVRGVHKELKKLRRKQILEMATRKADDEDFLSEADESEDSPEEVSEEEPDESDVKAEDAKEEGSRPELSIPEPPDLEKDIPPSRVVAKQLPVITPDPILSPGPHEIRGLSSAAQKRRISNVEGDDRGSWQQNRSPASRGGRGGRGGSSGGGRSAKQARRGNDVNNTTALAQGGRNSTMTPALNQIPKEKPDAKHHLKFTYGVNAWKHWVVQKNAELEKARAQGKYMKTFETDILKLRADELIYTLCMFVKEVRKPNGESYTPDSMLYLTLGIQEYLFENGRIDNIFTDLYYEPFTNALHEVVKDFKLPVNDHGYFITRIEEEHLWEAKQLGAHSPQVLLNTLIYFNTKYFLLKTVEQHKKLSFAHIMKHWKKSGSAMNTPSKGSQVPLHQQQLQQQKTILLRYYPPPTKGKSKADEKRCLEQHENVENPLRCPVKLYEFYLSKCPESTKTRNDLFYLQPERSCVPDSPVWYSTVPLNGHQLDKMLQRLLMIKEVQEHMIADAC